jgi:hypothetical protein
MGAMFRGYGVAVRQCRVMLNENLKQGGIGYSAL